MAEKAKITDFLYSDSSSWGIATDLTPDRESLPNYLDIDSIREYLPIKSAPDALPPPNPDDDDRHFIRLVAEQDGADWFGKLKVNKRWAHKGVVEQFKFDYNCDEDVLYAVDPESVVTGIGWKIVKYEIMKTEYLQETTRSIITWERETDATGVVPPPQFVTMYPWRSVSLTNDQLPSDIR